MERSFPRVLVLGDLDHLEFSDVQRWLAANAEVVQIDDQRPVNVGVIFQSRPGQIPQRAIEAVHARMPWATLVAVLGSWCEGETRTGTPLHGIERVFWYEAVSRLSNLLFVTGGRGTPRMESHAELILRQVCSLDRSRARQLAMVVSTRRHAFESLLDACNCLGFAAQWHPPGKALPQRSPDVVICDADEVQPWLLSQVASIRGTWGGVPQAVLLNFPRRNDIRQLLAAGCQTVLGKPFSLQDLGTSLGASFSFSQSSARETAA